MRRDCDTANGRAQGCDANIGVVAPLNWLFSAKAKKQTALRLFYHAGAQERAKSLCSKGVIQSVAFEWQKIEWQKMVKRVGFLTRNAIDALIFCHSIFCHRAVFTQITLFEHRLIDKSAARTGRSL